MGDGDKLKSPKGKGGVMNRIGGVVQTFSPRKNYKNKMKSKSFGEDTASEDADDQQQQVKAEGTASPTNVGGLTGIEVEPSKDSVDEKSEELKFFYEGKDSGEFSSPFTAQFTAH
mmetsp:Transcript_15260/g.37465  ORF Transcript_15260/g.37465 Transcript_15260/m.37465 type:complete len:115 (+) Transcript_15260:489-833(+)|eukprot:CAMPEP_0113616806 /NCGR_PEP_ID=MMETSP0017_2-20120614/8437_1 /TAXON_ID=2856 /ORGANISM="Cylindrotheca closterium" /LENGTH=114 /DNA_ID=CAMNT_0000526147 /DNA_START=260 /DNA_END=604 /DNA_ORIENTATION=+ /assembly_acc=CAM_ASM_000147